MAAPDAPPVRVTSEEFSKNWQLTDYSGACPGWGGKSELYRAGRSVMRSGGDPKESATERETAPTLSG